MSMKDIVSNPDMLREWIEEDKAGDRQYDAEHPDSLLPRFEKEVRDMGFQFETRSQITIFMPKQKKLLLPLAIAYYQQARDLNKWNEQGYFLDFFRYKECEEVVPMLLQDYYAPDTTRLITWCISDCLYQIRSKKYLDAYLDIIQNPRFGRNRQMLILLIGQWKVEKAIPILIQLLEQEDVRLHAISALGDFKREEFRCYFERFEKAKHSGWRKYARIALKKLDKAKEKHQITPQ